MFGTMSVSVARLAGGTRLLAAYGVTFEPDSPNASRVALMLRSMYGASLSRRLGLTVKVCTAHG
jgi:hypothetical protein